VLINDEQEQMREDGGTIVGKTDHSHEQKLVDEVFDASSTFWRDTYLGKDAFGINVRQRQAAALSYIDELSLPTATRVLEIGCGAGFMAIALARRGFAVEAVDHVHAMIELTQTHARQTGTANRIHASIEDIHELTFEDESFDLIVALGVMHWLHDLRKAMLEIARVLKPGGYVVLNIPRSHAFLNPLSVPAFESILERVKREVVKPALHDGRNFARPHTYLPKEFNQYLSAVNLTIIKSTTVGFGPVKILNREVFSKIQQRLQQFAGSKNPILRAAGSQYIILAKKDSKYEAAMK
jgi:2-polyprenyl-3-methyl-5-hydroxy-6-metoxy-1,4-benzoquinol methylase